MSPLFTPILQSHYVQAIANHLWQSTLFAAAAAIVAVLLRQNQARTRYWIWFAASLKFAVPLSLLISLGGLFASARPSLTAMQPASFYAIDVASQPFTFLPALSPTDASRLASRQPAPRFAKNVPILLSVIWILGFGIVVARWWKQWQQVGRVLEEAKPAFEGREFDAVRSLRHQGLCTERVEIAISYALLEPGIFGILRPVLVWPAGFSERLSQAEMEAIVAHELWHLRRRDNLFAALHMLIETIFWFHPLVWWLQTRLVNERELACDEAVIAVGHAPQTYAESILKACEFCIESPVPCVSGVTGADLKKRIVRIMTQADTERLGMGRKILLALVAVLVTLGPIVFGVVNVPRVRAALLEVTSDQKLPSFEVATIKPTHSTENRRRMMMTPGKLSIENMPLKPLIEFAFDARSDAQVTGGPDWINTENYTIEAKEDDALAAALEKASPEERAKQVRLMMQSLLIDRFKLKVSRSSKETTVYALVVGKGGPKLTPSSRTEPASEAPNPSGPRMIRRGIMMTGRGELKGTESNMGLLADILSRQREAEGRVVLDKTGLTGTYDWSLHWSPEAPAPAFKGADADVPADRSPGPDGSGPTLFTALQEQLGLKLESQKGTVDTIVVDSVERPSEN
jgi:bla regulator protein BlaR1